MIFIFVYLLIYAGFGLKPSPSALTVIHIILHSSQKNPPLFFSACRICFFQATTTILTSLWYFSAHSFLPNCCFFFFSWMNLSLAGSTHRDTHTTGAEWLIREKYQTLHCRNITAFTEADCSLALSHTRAHIAGASRRRAWNQREKKPLILWEGLQTRAGRGACKCRQKISRFVLAKRLIHAHPRITWRGRRHGNDP